VSPALPGLAPPCRQLEAQELGAQLGAAQLLQQQLRDQQAEAAGKLREQLASSQEAELGQLRQQLEEAHAELEVRTSPPLGKACL
jgi:hypothetical protein